MEKSLAYYNRDSRKDPTQDAFSGCRSCDVVQPSFLHVCAGNAPVGVASTPERIELCRDSEDREGHAFIYSQLCGLVTCAVTPGPVGPRSVPCSSGSILKC